MILREKLLQMIMMGFTGMTPEAPEVRKMDTLIQQGLGGTILFHRNAQQSPQKLTLLVEHLKAQVKEKPTLFMAIDGEGGNCAVLERDVAYPDKVISRNGIKRLTTEYGYQEFLAAEDVVKEHETDLRAYYYNMASYLKGLGFNFNLAPVVDVKREELKTGCIGPYKRTLSSDPKKVVALAKEVITGHNLAGIPTAIKHWPGLGGDAGDTHKGETSVQETCKPFDLEVFNGLEDVAPAIMLSHTKTHFDPHNPASMSPSTYTILRIEHGYKGLLISDCLLMGGVAEKRTIDQRVIDAILAGNDVLIIAKMQEKDGDPDVMDDILRDVDEALQKKDDRAAKLAARINESYDRILKFKKEWYAQ